MYNSGSGKNKIKEKEGVSVQVCGITNYLNIQRIILSFGFDLLQNLGPFLPLPIPHGADKVDQPHNLGLFVLL